MALYSKQILVTSEATLINVEDVDGIYLKIQNIGPAEVHIGGENVSLENGYMLGEEQSLSLFVGGGESLYGICGDSDTTMISFLATHR